jgi:hypothetical protein
MGKIRTWIRLVRGEKDLEQLSVVGGTTKYDFFRSQESAAGSIPADPFFGAVDCFDILPQHHLSEDNTWQRNWFRRASICGKNHRYDSDDELAQLRVVG